MVDLCVAYMADESWSDEISTDLKNRTDARGMDVRRNFSGGQNNLGKQHF